MNDGAYDDAALLPTEYLKFEQAPNPGKKTGVWRVRSQRDDALLGLIRWHGPWRQYVFQPNNHTVFNAGCLDDILERLGTCNRMHRNILANRKARDAA